MPEFLHLIPPVEALDRLFKNLPDRIPPAELIDTVDCLERISASPVIAPHDLPEFSRSSVDGYAVRATSTHGASDSQPAYLNLAEETPMGSRPEVSLLPTQASLIHTGGMLPEGADSVVMLEYTQETAGSEIEVFRPVMVGENVILRGEDLSVGQIIIPPGTRIRPAEIGGLMALGIIECRVAIKPRVGIISTGDEVVPPRVSPALGQVRDVNSHTLAALVEQSGGEPVLLGIVPDSLEKLKEVAAASLVDCDMLVITAGSSASVRDLTVDAIHSLGRPGVLVHGVNVRPGKPTILAVCDDKPVIGLPGNPVSALVIAGLIVVPLIQRLSGAPRRTYTPSVRARLGGNIPSQAGREDWVAVRLVRKGEVVSAEPIFGKSNLIFSLAAADGLVRIAPDATGLEAGETVEVFLI
ncbi:MAG: molybdopterin molybdenumtransferase MoeA [Chloroflexi bacterium]|nr:molybdopterin molybdenumtransferase MoeA [Chloroflexota bacterium]